MVILATVRGHIVEGWTSLSLQSAAMFFLITLILAILAGIAYGTMFALVMFVEPKKAEMSVRIPPEGVAPRTSSSVASATRSVHAAPSHQRRS